MCQPRKKTDGTHGKKLIIEFDITPKSGFIGGNAVPTNDYAASGVYDEDGTEVERFADSEADTPKVNVPIDLSNNVIKTIYEGNSVQVSELYDRPNEEGWQYDYVDVSVTGIEGDSVSPTDCTAYDITVTYEPIYEAAPVGQANLMTGVSRRTATVHVLKPTVKVSVNDVEKYSAKITPWARVQTTVSQSHGLTKTQTTLVFPLLKAKPRTATKIFPLSISARDTMELYQRITLT